MWPILFFLPSIAFAATLEPRIIGGSATTIEKHPYMVSIHLNNVHHCGGTLISKSWVLTAAHCLDGKRVATMSLRIGSTYSNKQGTLIKNIKQIIIHELYDDDTYEFDVALIKLPSPINTHVNVVSLASSSTKLVTGSGVEVIGWGRTSIGGPMSSEMRYTELVIIDQQKCQKIFEYDNLVTQEMVCAGYMKGGKDACQGDSGGPLVQNRVQVGIVSWGAKCATPGYPGVYTRVPAVRGWISKHTGV